MENNSTLEKVLLACKRNGRSNYYYQTAFSQKDEEEKFDNSEKLEGKKFSIFCFICLLLLTVELPNINWKYTENCNMLTERTFDSAVFKIFLNIITICIFIEQ